MKLLDKLKNAIFEDEELDQEEKEEIKEEPEAEEVVRQIDIEKTIPKRPTLSLEKELNLTSDDEEELEDFPKIQHRKTPVIFDEDDFIMEEEEMSLSRAYYDDGDDDDEEYEEKKLYGGYKDDKPREKFKPSPVLSPVYGYVSGASPVLEKPRNEKKSSFNEMLQKEKKSKVTIEKVREKAYGASSEEEKPLLYDMETEEKPAISKITIGDAEEYFEDLGLEYNVDYKDSAKTKVKEEDEVLKEKENEVEELTPIEDIELPDAPELDLDETAVIDTSEDLEITKEQLQPKSADEIKKVKKITDAELEPESVIDEDEPDEKNLYDLIDMMYESKE